MFRVAVRSFLLPLSVFRFQHPPRALFHTSFSPIRDDDVGGSGHATSERESVQYDVCIVGAGPAGLSSAIRLKQLCSQKERDVSVCIVEKGAGVGDHILSGNVFEPTGLDELLPDWREDPSCPISACPVKEDRFLLLTKNRALRLPTPPQMKNKGNYVVSLSETVRWLAKRAEELGVEIYPGFAATGFLQTEAKGPVRGIVTNDVGIDRNGNKKETFARGMAIESRVTLLAEGCRGSLSQEAIRKFGLRDVAGASPQTYALGIKEVWEVSPERHTPGKVWHTVGWPLPLGTYGGGWVYHMSKQRISIGLVVGLDYSDPYLNPFQEFQQFKRHPSISALLQGGTCLEYGARCLNEGGLQSIPKLHFDGGAIIGDSAGFLNVPKIKGTHTAIKSGMIAAEAAFDALTSQDEATSSPSGGVDMSDYQRMFEESWVHRELHRVRNIRPGFSHFGGLLGGMAYAAIDTFVLRGNAPWTLRHRFEDHERLRPVEEHRPRTYPPPDGVLTFDIPTSLHRSGTNHDHDQPSHLRLLNPKIPSVVNVPFYDGPEGRYCPAGVYEYVQAEDGAMKKGGGSGKKLQINAQNCLHCKACDIKDPRQNIRWTPPEGGGGPTYTCC